MVHNTLGHRVTQSEVEQWHKHCRMLHRLPSNRPRATISLPLVASFGRSPPSVISPPLWRRLVLGGDAYWTCSPHRPSPPWLRMTRKLVEHLKELENYRSAACELSEPRPQNTWHDANQHQIWDWVCLNPRVACIIVFLVSTIPHGLSSTLGYR